MRLGRRHLCNLCFTPWCSTSVGREAEGPAQLDIFNSGDTGERIEVDEVSDNGCLSTCGWTAIVPPFAELLSFVLGIRLAFDLRADHEYGSNKGHVFATTLCGWQDQCARSAAYRLNRQGLLQHVISRRRDCHESRTSQA